MKSAQQTYDKIYDALEARLNQTGPITTDEAWKICQHNYQTTGRVFRDIMNTMVLQKKAIKVRNGKWNISKPNARMLKKQKLK